MKAGNVENGERGAEAREERDKKGVGDLNFTISSSFPSSQACCARRFQWRDISVCSCQPKT